MMEDTEPNVYHEQQRRMMCALHTLNNLFQDQKAFTQQELDSICYSLTPESFINPHKNIVGLGNYDVNVIFAALQLKDYEAVWFDRRLSADLLDPEKIFGFIINKPSSMSLLGLNMPIKRPHWFAVRRIGSDYYNLDSKLPSPQCLGDESTLLEFLKDNLDSSTTQLLLVVTKEVAEAKTWKREDKQQTSETRD